MQDGEFARQAGKRLPGMTKGIRRHHMQIEQFCKAPDRISHAWNERAIAGQGAVEIRNQVIEPQNVSAGNGDLKHQILLSVGMNRASWPHSP